MKFHMEFLVVKCLLYETRVWQPFDCLAENYLIYHLWPIIIIKKFRAQFIKYIDS